MSRVAVVVALVCSLGVASGVAVAGTTLVRALLAQPGPEPSSCDPEPERQQEKARYHGEPLCGSRMADRLTASPRGGHHIRGFQGNDLIRAQNGEADEIRGDSGRDTAYIDAKDVVVGVEVCKPIPCRSARLSASAVTHPSRTVGADEFRYPAYISRTECRVLDDGTRQMWFISEPILRAVNASPRVDWQTVAWSPVLYKFENSQWVKVEEEIWLWDRTNDTSPPDRLHQNWWRRFDGSKPRTMLSFELSGPGVYQVRLRLYWYKTARVPEYLWEDDAESVDPHYSAWGFGSPTFKWCVFP
jgi:hypothetical protein